MKKLIYIIGAGEGIAQGTAELFGKQEFEVVLFARTETRLMKMVDDLAHQDIEASYYLCDAGNTENLQITLQKAIAEKGAPTVLHYNAAVMKQVNILDESADALVDDFKVNVAGLLTSVKAVKEGIKGDPEATILVTGGGFAMYPSADFGSLSIGKAGIRNLTQSLYRSLKPEGIHVGTVIVCGLVHPSDSKYSPALIAAEFEKLFLSRDDWEIVY